MTLADKVVTYSSVFSPILPLLFCWKRLNRHEIVITGFILFSFSVDLVTTYLVRANIPFLHVYGLGESLLLIYFFSLVLRTPGKLSFWLIAVLFTILYVLDSWLLEWGQFNSYGRSGECVLIIVLSLLLFYQFYRDEDDIFIERSPLFWINVSLITYFSGALFSFLLSEKILSGPMPWILHNISNILKNVILAVALWRIKPTQ